MIEVARCCERGRVRVPGRVPNLVKTGSLTSIKILYNILSRKARADPLQLRSFFGSARPNSIFMSFVPVDLEVR